MKEKDGIVIGFFVVALLILVASVIFNKGITGYVAANQTSCPGELTSDIYVLTKNIYYSINPSTTGNVVYNPSTKPSCIKVTQPDTIINCNGHGIYNSAGGAQINGIYSDKQHTQIFNCKVNMGSAGTGIVLENSDQFSVSGNTIYGNNVGVYVRNSNGAGAVISDNDIKNNSQGIVSEGSSVVVNKNNLTNNNYGLSSNGDIITQISFNFLSNNANDGIALQNPISGNVNNNTITYNKGSGINVYFNNVAGGGSNVYGNYLSFNRIGINLFGNGSGSNYIGFNNVYSSDSYGIVLSFTNSNSIIANGLYVNKGSGIYLGGSSGNRLEQNIVSGNQDSGLYFENSNNNNILNNNVDNNLNHGFSIISSSNNKLSGNKATRHGIDGFYILSSSGNNLSNNEAHSNGDFGANLYFSSGNYISNNDFSGNKYSYDIYLSDSPNNVISGSSFYDANNPPSQQIIDVINPNTGGGSPEDNAFVSVPGSAPTTYRPSSSVLGSGYSKYLKANDRIEFNLLGATHSLRLQSVSSSGATVVVSSDPITIGLQVQESKKVNLENDNFYDLVVRLDSVRNNNEAQIYVRSIREFAPGASLADSEGKEVLGELDDIIKDEGQVDSNTTKYLLIGLIIILLVAAVIIVFLTVNKSREQKRVGGMSSSNFPRPVGWKVD